MGTNPVRALEGETVRVFLVAGHGELRHSLGLLLEGEGMTLSGWSASAAAAPRSLADTTDVVVVALPEVSGDRLDAVRELAARPDAPPCLVVAVNDDVYSICQAFAAGARGYVPNRSAWQVLPQTIRDVVAARARISRSLRRRA